jgi:glycosyltransferase involved in cell wall biosynthesis
MSGVAEKKLKIIRIIARLNVGGPARHVVWLTDALNDTNYSSVLIAGSVPEGEEDMSYFARQHGVEPIYIEEMSRELSPKDIVSLWKVFKTIWREKPDIIHTHTAKAGTIGRAAGLAYKLLSFRKVVLIHTYHGHIFHSYYGAAKTKLFLFIEKTLARFATDRIITISDQQFKEIHSDFGVGKTRQFSVIRLGLDLKAFEDSELRRSVFRDEIGIQEDEIAVALVGRLTEIKNHSFFLRVAKLYKDTKTSDFPDLKFVIIGDGNLRTELEAEAKALEIDDLVMFTGNRDDTPTFYPGLDIIALTSRNEGTPLSLIEGMANSRAVISTPVGGVVDLAGDLVNETTDYKICQRAVLANGENPEGFLNGLIALAADPVLRQEMGSRGVRFVKDTYSKDALVSNIRNLYQEVAK